MERIWTRGGTDSGRGTDLVCEGVGLGEDVASWRWFGVRAGTARTRGCIVVADGDFLWGECIAVCVTSGAHEAAISKLDGTW